MTRSKRTDIIFMVKEAFGRYEDAYYRIPSGN